MLLVKKPRKSPKASFRPKEIHCLPLSWALLILGLAVLESGGRDWPQVGAEAASPQQGSDLAQTPAETLAAGVTAGTYDRGGKAGAFRATPMRKLAVLLLNKIWNRYFGHFLFIYLETERSSVKLPNKKSHNDIEIERNESLYKDPGFLSNKLQKRRQSWQFLGCWCFLNRKIELASLCHATIPGLKVSQRGMDHSCPLLALSPKYLTVWTHTGNFPLSL